MTDVEITLGTRPEVIKLSKIIEILRGRSQFDLRITHLGQHYSEFLSDVFFEELDLPEPDRNLRVGSQQPSGQVGQAIDRLGTAFEESQPDVVLAFGDTNSVLASAIASTKSDIPFGHIEAGLRSFDERMPEETNRKLADQVADFCFAPTDTVVHNLQRTGVDDTRIYQTGHPIVEITREYLSVARQRSSVLDRLDLHPDEYVVVTFHRKENIAEYERLETLLNVLERIAEPVVFPIHPGTEARLRDVGLYSEYVELPDVSLINPLGYLDFLSLCSNARLIMSDSGGVQEEATIYKKPILVLRDSTERPEILGTFGETVEFTSDSILDTFRVLTDRRDELVSMDTPFGDGVASQRIVDVLEEDL